VCPPVTTGRKQGPLRASTPCLAAVTASPRHGIFRARDYPEGPPGVCSPTKTKRAGFFMPLPFSHCRHCEAWPPWYASKERYKKAGRGYICAASPGRCLKSFAPTWPGLRPAPSRTAAVTGSIQGKAGPLRVPAPDGKTGYKQAALRAAPDGQLLPRPSAKALRARIEGAITVLPRTDQYYLQGAAYRF
jgi:hypothetical protein